MKELNKFLTENKYDDAVKAATKVLINDFGFKKVRRGSEEGVEKDGKYCKVQVCEMPYDSCLVIDTRWLFTSKHIFDYLVYIDTRKKFRNAAYILDADDLMEYIKQNRDKKFEMWPTTASERGTNNINPLGITIRIHPIKNSNWFTEVKPEEKIEFPDNPDFFPTGQGFIV